MISVIQANCRASEDIMTVIPHDDFTLTKLQCDKRVTHEVT
jgi:hypothetical protein